MLELPGRRGPCPRSSIPDENVPSVELFIRSISLASLTVKPASCELITVKLHYADV